MRLWIVLAVIVTFAVPMSAFGEAADTFKGLPGVYVMVFKAEGEGSFPKKVYDRSQVQADLEMHLRTAGITVLTQEEWRQHPTHPLLSVDVSVLEIREVSGYVYSVILHFAQMVDLDSGQRAPAATWDNKSLGTDYVSNTRVIQDVVKDLAGPFINGWLSVNPKK